MEVSTFELLYKPLTPSLGAGTEAIARRVLQGYFLTIANLESSPFLFRIAFNITLPNPDNPARRLDGNTLFITDVGSNPDNVFATSLTRSPAGGNRYIRTFTVPANATALVVLLPNITVPGFFGVDNQPNIEIRGHVGLVLPWVFKPSGLGSFIFGPQNGAPARVLLTAEHRSTYLPLGWPGGTISDLDFDQTGVSLPLASGQALNEVPSANTLFSVPEIGPAAFPEAFARQIDLIESVDPVTAIVGGLVRLEQTPETLAKLGGLLDELGIPLRVEAASPRQDKA